jgi:hypothetical protein
MSLYWVNIPHHFTYFLGDCEFRSKCCYAPDNEIYMKLYNSFTSGFNFAKRIHTFNFVEAKYEHSDQIFYSDISSSSDEEEYPKQQPQQQQKSVLRHRREVSNIGIKRSFKLFENEKRCQCVAVGFNKDCEVCNAKISCHLTAKIRYNQSAFDNDPNNFGDKSKQYLIYRANKRMRSEWLRIIFGDDWKRFDLSEYQW